MSSLLDALPKVELHLHLEGTLEPEMAFRLAAANGVMLPAANVETLRRAYAFKDLQSFLDLYYQVAAVLCTEDDFFALTWAYLRRCHQENIRHVEVFFDPQTHTDRGLPFADVIGGIDRALRRGEQQFSISSELILCFLRHKTEEDAFSTLASAETHLDRIAAVGLDSSERGYPPRDFQRVFARAREMGLRCVAHAGEEGPPSYIVEALDLLQVERIDHGVRCVESPELVRRLAQDRVPLTVCPLSNVRLRVFDSLEGLPLPALLAAGLCVTINSDDPAFFGGYLSDNFRAVQEVFALDDSAIRGLTHNAIDASFASDARKRELRDAVEACGRAPRPDGRPR